MYPISYISNKYPIIKHKINVIKPKNNLHIKRHRQNNRRIITKRNNLKPKREYKNKNELPISIKNTLFH